MAPIQVSEEDGVRYLHFGSRWVQGAMRIARPWSLELEYTRDMMLPLLLRSAPSWPRSALLIGLGAASLTKFLYRHRPRTRISVVEWDERVAVAAYRHFKLPHDPPRLTVAIDEGSAFLARTQRSYDLILVDGFDENARPGPLESSAFYRLCRSRLTDTGVMAANLLGRSRGSRATIERIAAEFPERCIALGPSESGNRVVLASRAEGMACTLDELGARAKLLRTQTTLNLGPSIDRLASQLRGDRLEI